MQQLVTLYLQEGAMDAGSAQRNMQESDVDHGEGVDFTVLVTSGLNRFPEVQRNTL